MAEETDILFDVKNGIGLITLNRPQALNALNMPMIQGMNRQLSIWAVDSDIRAVVVMGAGRTFCSGGDVKAAAQGTPLFQQGLFRAEYTLNHRIFRFPKPYIALIDGIVMGGGKGISAHGTHRVVSEKMVFAMPETSIGFFPDVGGGYFLSRCPGQTGLYLALTSKKINAADAAYIGFATDFVESKDFPALLESICAETNIDALIKSFSRPTPGDSALAAARAAIDRCFSHNRVEDIVNALTKEGTEWADETLHALHAMSPLSLKVALRQIRLGSAMSFEDVMIMEYRLSQAFMRGRDFYEGIRAALIDKDKNPRWSPASLEDVTDDAVARYFDSLKENDLVLWN